MRARLDSCRERGIMSASGGKWGTGWDSRVTGRAHHGVRAGEVGSFDTTRYLCSTGDSDDNIRAVYTATDT